MDRSISIAGLVLAGGLSSRFGTDKALARFDGTTLLQSSLARFALCQAKAVAVRSDGPVAEYARALGAAVIIDPPDATSGPLAGIAAGLTWASTENHEFLAIAPCDAPLLRWGHYDRLLADIGDACAAFAVSGGAEHPLCAVWRCDLLSKLQTAMAEGKHPSVRGFLRDQAARPIVFDDPQSFANANTTAALARMMPEIAP